MVADVWWLLPSNNSPHRSYFIIYISSKYVRQKQNRASGNDRSNKVPVRENKNDANIRPSSLFCSMSHYDRFRQRELYLRMTSNLETGNELISLLCDNAAPTNCKANKEPAGTFGLQCITNNLKERVICTYNDK